MLSRSVTGRFLAGALVGAATAIVILAVTILPFLSPAWVGFEQDRAGAEAWTGYSPAELHRVTNSILGDLVIGSGDFGVTVDGVPVLNERERSHMRDVRGVFDALGLLAIVSFAGLGLAAWRARGPAARDRLWASVRNGARGLAAAIAVVGIVAVVAFDAAFELFHRLFFAAGSYDFDPRTDRIVQLFPDQFWSETTIVLGLVGLVAALAVGSFAARRRTVAAGTGVAANTAAGAGAVVASR